MARWQKGSGPSATPLPTTLMTAALKGRLGSKEMRQGVSCPFTRTYILGLWCRSPRLREEWQNETVRDTF